MSGNAKSSTMQIRVACVGDSLTEISGYPNALSKMLGEGYVVGNFGVCGSTVLLDSEYPYLYSGAFEDASAFQPNIAVVMLGTNDAGLSLEQFSGNFIEDYITLLERFEALASRPKLWIVKPPPIFGAFGLSRGVFDGHIIPTIEKIASRANLPMIDVYSAMNRPDYFFDGVHPTEKGARIIAQEVYKAITSKQINQT